MSAPQPPSADALRLLRRAEMLRRTGLRPTQQRMLEAEDRFPRKVPLGDRSIAWRSDEVERWIEARSAERLTNNGKEKGGNPTT